MVLLIAAVRAIRETLDVIDAARSVNYGPSRVKRRPLPQRPTRKLGLTPWRVKKDNAAYFHPEWHFINEAFGPSTKSLPHMHDRER
jgi:hypothetical protein